MRQNFDIWFSFLYDCKYKITYYINTKVFSVFVLNSDFPLHFLIIMNRNLIAVDNGADAETVPINTHLFISLTKPFIEL